MTISVENKMKITCSECQSHYSMTRGEISALPWSVMQCRRCRQKIKIIICPECFTCYTVNFSEVKSQRYMMTCRQCRHTFVVSFPLLEKQAGQVTIEPKRKEPPAVPVTARKKPEPAPPAAPSGKSRVVFPPLEKKEALKTRALPEKKKKVSTGRKAGDVTLPGSFEPGDIAASVTGAFAPARVGVGFFGVLVMMLSYHVCNAAGNALQGVPVLGALSPWITAGILFFLYTVVASAMAKGAFDELLFGQNRGISLMIKTSFQLIPSLLGVSFLVLVLFEVSLLLFGLIPLVGPLLFALLFLPVYGISLGAVLLVTVGFWFYPPLSVHRKSGIGSNAVNIFHFIKKHNLKLFLVIPILAGFSLVGITGLFLLHHGALLLSGHLASSVMGERFGTILASVPFSLQSLGDVSAMAHAAGQYGLYLGALVTSESAAGVLLGLVMVFITALLGALSLSLVTSLSTYTYLSLERGSEPGARKTLVLMGMVVLFLVMILLLRRLIG